jgi:hypothetical protein
MKAGAEEAAEGMVDRKETGVMTGVVRVMAINASIVAIRK